MFQTNARLKTTEGLEVGQLHRKHEGARWPVLEDPSRFYLPQQIWTSILHSCYACQRRQYMTNIVLLVRLISTWSCWIQRTSKTFFASAPSGIAYLSPEQLGKTILLLSRIIDILYWYDRLYTSQMHGNSQLYKTEHVNKIPGSLEHVSCLGWNCLVAFVLTECPYIYLPLLIYQVEQ
jgi:hypothetical protein